MPSSLLESYTPAAVTPASSPEPSTVSRHSALAEKLQDVRVLAAEDNAMNQKILKRFLAHCGVKHFVIANNGEECVQKLVAEPFDVILMDVMMPMCDGYAATRKIRNLVDPTKSNIPIIALTASALLADVERCMASGMNDVLAKPYTREDLRAKLQAIMDKDR